MSSDWSVDIVRHGRENEPVVVIDRFARDPEAFIDDAAFLGFRPIGEHYPGVRAEVPATLLDPLLAALAPIVAEVFAIDATQVVDSFYSIVTTPPCSLTPIQRLPHFDGVEQDRLALLHFLARDERSGTAFYRHRGTGFETVDAGRLAIYRSALDAEISRDGLPESGYIAGDTFLFEQVARHAGRFNRAILYRSNTLHCADIPADMNMSRDPATGRLTVNTFLKAAR